MRSILRLLPMLLLTAPLLADDSGTNDKLNRKIDGVTFVGLDAKPAPLSVAKDSKATVVVFLSFDCPVSNSYSPTLIELHKAYAAKGIDFLGVCVSDEPAAVARQVAEFKLPFPVVTDPKHVGVDAFHAAMTPEAFVLDHNSHLRYRGRIDNAWAARLKKNNSTTENDLQKALDEILAGKPVSTPVTKAIGCPVIAKSDARPTTKTTFTYHKDVAPIIQVNCQGCHRPGEVGPFSLMTYKQAVNWAEDIREYTRSKRMPPWKPIAGLEFHNDRRMSDKDIALLTSWIDGGTPEGDIKDAPAPIKYPEGWAMGKPDLILTADADFNLAAGGGDIFRCFTLPTGLTEDKYIIGYDVRPGNPKVVHHTLNFFDTTGKARTLAKEQQLKDEKAKPADNGPGYSVGMGIGFIATSGPRPGVPAIGGFGGWAPGTVSRFLPEGTGYFLPKEADVVLQVHYHRNGRVEKDRTQIGLYFAKKPIDVPYRTLTLGGMSPLTLIPPGKADYKGTGAFYVNSEMTMHSVMPHMHLIGRSVKISMTKPGEKTIPLVDIPEWDYNWQETYWLKEPMKIPPGTKFEIEAIYDNSTANPNNPRTPPGYVRFGEETTNEMLFGFIGATAEKGKRIVVSRTPPDAKPEVKPEVKK